MGSQVKLSHEIFCVTNQFLPQVLPNSNVLISIKRRRSCRAVSVKIAIKFDSMILVQNYRKQNSFLWKCHQSTSRLKKIYVSRKAAKLSRQHDDTQEKKSGKNSSENLTPFKTAFLSYLTRKSLFTCNTNVFLVTGHFDKLNPLQGC